MSQPKVHYAGPLRMERGNRLSLIAGGWAACCSGDRARQIARAGHQTYYRSCVTCRRCLSQIAAAKGSYYYCRLCHKQVWHDSTKAWITSVCSTAGDKTTRMMRI